jgi:galactokinase
MNYPDTAAFIELFKNRSAQFHFDSQREVIVTRAPGRLDLMGGIADYSGSLVLQLPIANASHVALQRRDDETIRIISLMDDPGAAPRQYEMTLSDFRTNREPIDYDLARDRFRREPADHWAAYVAGAFLALMRERSVEFEGGADILISSQVPEGKGVSSSAALEVSVMQAIARAFNCEIPPSELAFLCQKVENLIAGAPCGVMDQMTAACGEADRLLSLLCQPGEVRGTVKLPHELQVWGIDSGIRHAVAGADYGTVRTAAFMGYRMIAEITGLRASETGNKGLVKIDDQKWNGYLANVTPADFEGHFARQLPETLMGSEFLKRYGGITDPVTTVKPDVLYPIFQATRHPIYEHARVKAFAEILESWSNIDRAQELGELMYQSHDSYSACGLGSSGTDAIIRLAREAGIDKGVYGAKITGGGSGGTVAILGNSDAEKSVDELCEKYAAQTGHKPIVICGSSSGAGAFDHLKLC